MTVQYTYIPKQTNHVLHLILSLLTLGLWVPMWILMAIINTGRRDRIMHVQQSPVAQHIERNMNGQMGQLPFSGGYDPNPRHGPQTAMWVDNAGPREMPYVPGSEGAHEPPVQR